MSDQFASASVQTNQVLDMSSMSVSSSTSGSSLDTTGVGSSVVVSSNTSTAQNQLDTSINAIDTSSDTETVVEDLIAQNLQTAQEEVEAEQEETGEYGSEDTIIAYMGFVPGFNNYQKVVMVDQTQWYASKTIYTTTMSDNLEAFYGLASSNISKMSDIIELQPKL
jgi:vacuolar-type H+-ATPase subunit I/STV1